MKLQVHSSYYSTYEVLTLSRRLFRSTKVAYCTLIQQAAFSLIKYSFFGVRVFRKRSIIPRTSYFKKIQSTLTKYHKVDWSFLFWWKLIGVCGSSLDFIGVCGTIFAAEFLDRLHPQQNGLDLNF